jgi:hypothetical protein
MTETLGTELDIIAKLKMAEADLYLIIIEEEENGEGIAVTSDLRRVIEIIQNAILKIQLQR